MSNFLLGAGVSLAVAAVFVWAVFYR